MPHHHHSREEIAKAEIGHTDTTPGVCRFLTLAFIAVIVSVPLLQFAVEYRPRGGEPSLPSFRNAGRILPSSGELKHLARAGSIRETFRRAWALNNRMLRDITEYETDLKDRSVFVDRLIPFMQTIVTGWLRGGNEDAYCGRRDWLFYRRDIDHLTGPGFLEPRTLARRAAGGNEWTPPPQPDPLKAILDFRDQLASRGIQLVLMPVPVKPAICPGSYTARSDGARQPLYNPSHDELLKRLEAADVPVFGAGPLLADAQAATGTPAYLKADTHWTPRSMELAARALADFVRERLPSPAQDSPAYDTTEACVTNTGDIAAMLRLPPGQTFYTPETVTVRQVTDGERLWRPSPSADVLLLGDSFSNIFSLDGMGWGEAAGFAEHLGLALGRPIDALRRNDAGAWATRNMLAGELRRGNDRLAGKKLVIWEFAARELSGGDWKLIPLELGEKQPATFFVPPDGASPVVRGVVAAAASAPRPGAVPYRDHIVMVHLTDLEGVEGQSERSEAVVLMWSMRDNVWTHAARYRPGERITVRLRPWVEVSETLDAINRSELDDDDLLLADPCWGEEQQEEKQ